jgi:hypothetical protein
LPSVCLTALGKESARGVPPVRYFAECLVWHSAKRGSLPSTRATTLGKEPIPVSKSWFFAECYSSDTLTCGGGGRGGGGREGGRARGGTATAGVERHVAGGEAVAGETGRGGGGG